LVAGGVGLIGACGFRVGSSPCLSGSICELPVCH
jgi:hypothetical protein